jgi:hypothetical protein
MGEELSSQVDLNECLALTHALETVAAKRDLAEGHRMTLASELHRIADTLSGAKARNPANSPELVGLKARPKFDEQSGALKGIIVDPWRPKSTKTPSRTPIDPPKP